MAAAAWKTKPSWAIVAMNDQIINPDLERWYYARAKSHTVEIKGAVTPCTNRILKKSLPS